ncbi:pentatricopeptide repeat-containing protein At4g01990, mitochondrial-like [Phoenix dactylifera]|uniref:Pentatricopeptide repeat-containing protein At4g01990, mitochondrial-like n=1 Tax=Phoenix dactylifera TaxID=42345 RepID=A0A8B7CZY0_PHODC|nr:pentatricopeptide repeat-containing protein At4g01990, mitochondrial-like [Phoenix dactylifera]
MAKNPIRAPPWWPAVLRRLTTASASEMKAQAAREEAEWKPLYRRLSALGGAPEGRVTATLDQWEMEGWRMTALQLMKHIRELRKYRRHEHALEMMHWMEKRSMEMPNGYHAVRLDLISKVKGVRSAEEYFSNLPEPAKNQRTYGALFNCYCSGKMTDRAVALLEKMKELKFASNVLIYNNLMSLYMKLGQLEMVPILFQEMKASNVLPDSCTYRIIMKSYASVSDMVSVERVTQEMEESRGASDCLTYCHLASLYNSVGLFEKAETALKKAELVLGSHELSPFRLLISSYAAAGNLSEVSRVWNSFKARVPRPTNTNYLIMLQALRKLDDMDGLKRCFEEWESGCVNYDIRLVNTVIEAYLRKGMVDEAKLLQEKADQKGEWSDVHTFVLFIDHYLKSRELELARKCSKLANSIVKKGWLKTVETDDVS